MQETSSNTCGWPEPLPLEEVPLLPWPENSFPPPFEMFVKELARSTETPIELAAMLTLSAVATATHKRYQVQIKADYSEPVNIWSVVVLPPASRKTRVHGEVAAPLKKWECEQKKIFEPQIQSAESKRKTTEARLKELRNNAAKSGDENKYNATPKCNFLQVLRLEVPCCRTFHSPSPYTLSPVESNTISVGRRLLNFLRDFFKVFALRQI